MKLRAKFNLMLGVVFSIGLGFSGYLSYTQLNENARNEVLGNAGVLMESLLAARTWAVKEVGPNLRETEDDEFLMMGVPPYVANKLMEDVKKRYPEFGYREVALNPMNPKDHPADWEAKIVDQFRSQPDYKEHWGIRQTPTGPMLYLARPINIPSSGCLGCHSKPENAPAHLVKEYGSSAGFGWKLKEIVGAQIVSVPMAIPIANAQRMFITFMGALSGVFLVLFVLLDVMLVRLIIKPLGAMAQAANEISKGNLEISEFNESGKDEVAYLAVSFNRMRRSLVKALAMFNRTSGAK
jgi:protein-histidine pros-kinase